MIVFLVSGLGHGANWTFVCWGLLHGAYQIIGGMLRPVKDRLNRRFSVNTQCFSYQFGQGVITFVLVCIAWIFFRAETISDALSILAHMFTRPDPWALFDGTIYTLGLARPQLNILLCATGVLMAFDLVKYETGRSIDVFLASQILWFPLASLIGLFMSIVIFGMYGPAFNAQAFIYFQF